MHAFFFPRFIKLKKCFLWIVCAASLTISFFPPGVERNPHYTDLKCEAVSFIAIYSFYCSMCVFVCVCVYVSVCAS